MPRISQSQIQALPDTISADLWTLNLGQIPNWGDTTGLTLKCAQVTLPGVSTEAFQMNVAGYVRNFRGRKMWARTLQVVYFEDSLMRTHNAMRSWMEFIVGTDSGTSADYIAGYGVTAGLSTYDTTGAQIDIATFYNLFLYDLQDTSLNSESTQAALVTALFHYDYAVYGNVAIR